MLGASIVLLILQLLINVIFVMSDKRLVRFDNFVGDNVIVRGTADVTTSTASFVGCAITCMNDIHCKGFNAQRTDIAIVKCYLFYNKETDVFNNVQTESDADYFEMSCISPVSIAAASAGQSNTNHYRTEITYKGEDAKYSLILPKTLGSHSSPFYEKTITSSTSGQFNHIDSIFTSFTEGMNINWYIVGGDVTCTVGPSIVCSPNWPQALSSLASGTYDVTMLDAFMPLSNSFDGAYAFAGDYVVRIKINTTDRTRWIIQSKDLLRSDVVWKGAPTGIKAAAWIDRSGTATLDTSHAVLFTDTHFFVYNLNFRTVVYRSQICV